MSLLTDCIYSQCLRRIIDSLHRARIAFPHTAIFLFKYDLDSAYRRLHIFPPHAVKTITVVNDRAYIIVRFPFGVKCGLGIYSDLSESIFDLANDLLADTAWNPSVLRSPHQHLLEKPETPTSATPFSPTKPLAVDIPLRTTFTDGYIDDAITFAVDQDQNVHRTQNTIPLAVHTIFHPARAEELSFRADPIPLRKLGGDGTPSALKLVLG